MIKTNLTFVFLEYSKKILTAKIKDFRGPKNPEKIFLECKRSKKANETGEVIIKFLLWMAVFVILAIGIFLVSKKYLV